MASPCILSRQLKPFLFFVKGHCDNSLDFFVSDSWDCLHLYCQKDRYGQLRSSPSIYLYSLAMEIYWEDV